MKSSLSLSICVLGAVAILSFWGSLVEAFDEPVHPLTRQGTEIAADFIDDDLKEKMDPTSYKLTPQERRTIAALEVAAKKKKKSLKIGIGMTVGGALLFLLGALTAAKGKGALQGVGFGSMIAGGLTEVFSLVPYMALDSYQLKMLDRKKELKMLFEDRLKAQKNNDLKTRMLKRRIIGEDGKLIGSDNKEYDHDKLTSDVTYTPDLH